MQKHRPQHRQVHKTDACAWPFLQQRMDALHAGKLSQGDALLATDTDAQLWDASGWIQNRHQNTSHEHRCSTIPARCSVLGLQDRYPTMVQDCSSRVRPFPCTRYAHNSCHTSVTRLSTPAEDSHYRPVVWTEPRAKTLSSPKHNMGKHYSRKSCHGRPPTTTAGTSCRGS